MATENLTPDQSFRLTSPLAVDFDGEPGTIAENSLGWTSMISIYEADLSVAQARRLRDWLNAVLPNTGVHDVEEFYRE